MGVKLLYYNKRPYALLVWLKVSSQKDWRGRKVNTKGINEETELLHAKHCSRDVGKGVQKERGNLLR